MTPPSRNGLSTIEEVIADAKAGKLFILVDDEDRENEGDLCVIGEYATADSINFMAKYGRGLICLALTRIRTEQLGLTMMERRNESRHETAFTISIEAREGVTTGISAADRALTIKTAIDPNCGERDITTPGHIFPLIARDGGTLVRAGHTEAVVDIARACGSDNPSGVICEIMKDDGNMARLHDLLEFAKAHQLKIGTIADLIQYRSQTESIVVRESEREFMSPWCKFQGVVYRDKPSNSLHLALIKGQPQPHQEVLVRVHEPVTILDLLDTESSTHSWPLSKALEAIAQSTSGVAVLLN
ncbi:MAG TPA: 3,4-dihydroxy-2-butanone-4-phosphate synthase, partial [Alphaproteobacteria bacterium]|nr:3,4-dihydroxy-2-butanone-4-phosphate synthase [Alphaproteobacteria bacterium]